ncbi:hypothetical protein [Microbacterium sp. 2FI]|uniref:hypothetical protein n=1 Tax=Microbacterium sp. 2FI TaxID=2502193 RepID=UPI0010F67947|nr:hypothetical protein [Microbacterium sp. 2FI]
MTELDNARAALNDAAQAKALRVIPSPDRLVSALQALVAEHERLTTDLALFQEHAGLTFPRPLKFEPITDAQVEAALSAWVESAIGGASFDAMADYLRVRNRRRMRAALEAARAVS